MLNRKTIKALKEYAANQPGISFEIAKRIFKKGSPLQQKQMVKGIKEFNKRSKQSTPLTSEDSFSHN